MSCDPPPLQRWRLVLGEASEGALARCEGGVLLGLAALDEQARPTYDRDLAARVETPRGASPRRR